MTDHGLLPRLWPFFPCVVSTVYATPSVRPFVFFEDATREILNKARFDDDFTKQRSWVLDASLWPDWMVQLGAGGSCLNRDESDISNLVQRQVERVPAPRLQVVEKSTANIQLSVDEDEMVVRFW